MDVGSLPLVYFIFVFCAKRGEKEKMACVIDGGTVLSLTVSGQATWGHSRARGHCRGEGTVIPNFRTKRAFAEGSIDGSLF